MAYLRCTVCESKALVAASQCPRCAHPFNLTDARGERVKLKQCRGCGIMHRVDATCHWCGEQKSWLRLSDDVLRRAAAVALMVLGVGTVWRVGPSVRDFTSTLMKEARADLRRDPAAPVVTIASNESSAPARVSTVDPSAALLAVQDSASAIVSAIAGDSITWTPAVARTWVNVRADASRGGQVVGVIKPTTRAMLGTDRAGWRQVKSIDVTGDVTGWVDPRLFEADSLRTRGE